jgi:hypothetical protein
MLLNHIFMPGDARTAHEVFTELLPLSDLSDARLIAEMSFDTAETQLCFAISRAD